MEFKNMSGIYIFYKDQVLMMKRIKKDFCGAGQYYSIGGKFEKDDLNDPKKCILRELEEETGLQENDITNLKLKYIVFRNYDGLVTQNHLFFAELVDEKKIKECDEGTFEWIPISKIFTLPLPTSSNACLQDYFQRGMYSDELFLVGASDNDGTPKYSFIELSVCGISKNIIPTK